MCGITGIISSTILDENDYKSVELATTTLNKRGPDNQSQIRFQKASIGHARLSIIDTNPIANQPFFDNSGRYSIVFNGEIYNYKSLKQELIAKGISFITESDTEVLLNSFILYGSACLNKLHGFFAFAIYDSKEETTFIARDRFGIKPLLYYKSENQFYFGSEMKAILSFPIERKIDNTSLYTYLQLNYIPEPHSILEGVKKLEPGHYLKIDKNNKIQTIPFYQIDYDFSQSSNYITDYEEAKNHLEGLLIESVQERLVSDVPLGTFLSGGIDSSLITAIASKELKNLSTFSIGFENQSHFDESYYAQIVAKKYNTNHHTFYLNNTDLLKSLYETLEYTDEPFADSSALAVNALSSETSKHVKVALSGDGADELFAGYYKHMGEFQNRQKGLKSNIVSKLKPVWSVVPKNRNTALGNYFRKFDKFASGSSLSKEERYWLWAGLMNEADASNLLSDPIKADIYLKRKNNLIQTIKESEDYNAVLLSDVKMVLLSDMLRKVDMMSMANSLEVRTPFLGHKIVDYAFNLPSNFKINKNGKKRILTDIAKKYLPEEIYNRPKQGFEVPLLQWFNKELKELIYEDLMSDEFIRNQNIFNLSSIKQLREKLKSKNPIDSQGNVWALIVFNNWWKRYIG